MTASFPHGRSEAELTTVEIARRIYRLFRLFVAAGLLASGLGLPPAAALADSLRPPARSHMRALAAADDFGTPFLVEDLTTTGTPEASDPNNFVVLGGAVYFTGDTPATGREL